MADAVRVDEFVVPSQMEGEPDAQPDFTAAVTVSSPVRLDQLGAELAVRAELTEVALLSDGDPLQAADDWPIHLWTEDTVSPDVLEAAAQAHQPDSNWVPLESAATPRLDDIRQKAIQRRMLSMDEVQVAVRHLLSVEQLPG